MYFWLKALFSVMIFNWYSFNVSRFCLSDVKNRVVNIFAKCQYVSISKVFHIKYLLQIFNKLYTVWKCTFIQLLTGFLSHSVLAKFIIQKSHFFVISKIFTFNLDLVLNHFNNFESFYFLSVIWINKLNNISCIQKKVLLYLERIIIFIIVGKGVHLNLHIWIPYFLKNISVFEFLILTYSGLWAKICFKNCCINHIDHDKNNLFALTIYHVI